MVNVTIAGCVGTDQMWEAVVAAGSNCAEPFPAAKVSTSAYLQGGAVYVSLTTTVDAPVGRYVLSVLAGTGERVFSQSTTVAILFDPYNRKDDVYISSSKGSRAEYLENEAGLEMLWEELRFRG